jgi:ATP-binding cassette subfamily B protein
VATEHVTDRLTLHRADATVHRRVLDEARPFRLHLAAVFVLWAVGVPLALLVPVPGKIVLDTVLGSQPLPAFLRPLVPAALGADKDAVLRLSVALLLAIVGLKQLQGLLTSVLSAWIGQHLVLRFRSRLFRHVQRVSLEYHDSRGVTAALYRITQDARALETIALDGMIPIAIAVLTLLSMVYVTTRIDLRLALIALAVAPVLLLLTHFSSDPLRRQWRTVKDLDTSLQAVIQEVLSSLRVVKAFGQEGREADRFDRNGRESVGATIRVTASQGLLGLLLGLVIASGTGAVLYVGARHVQRGLLSVGDLILLMFYLAMLYGPLETITSKLAGLQSAIVSAERAFALLDVGTDVPEKPRAARVRRARGRVVFDNVSFGYSRSALILKNISFEAPPGAVFGLAGEIGSGKTTLLNLLPRFYDPLGGSVLLDGVDLRDYRVEDVRDQFGIVPQNPILFSTTVAENIAYGRPDASEGAIVEAARQANAEDFIRRLADGFATRVGEHGMLLSNGQRQLISLARAFLRNAPLLILDEPTSAVDPETEAIVMNALKRLVAGRTVFMVAHRLYTLSDCDRVLFLRNGTIGEPPAAVQASITRA